MARAPTPPERAFGVRAPLEGRVAIVTGASRGIGAGIAERLITAGARVLGVSRTRSGEPDDEVFVQVECDLTHPGAPELVLERALAAFGRVDALVNNAGLMLAGPCWEQSDADVEAMIELNLTAPFRLSQRLATHWLGDSAAPAVQAAWGTGIGTAPRLARSMAGCDGGASEGARGVIVNICSVESQVAWEDPPQAGYAATKGGLLALTRAMALELAPRGIRVVAVGPGIIATAMTPDSPQAGRAIPLGHRLGTPAEIGDAVVFLVSDAARYVTGEILYVDGGYLLP